MWLTTRLLQYVGSCVWHDKQGRCSAFTIDLQTASWDIHAFVRRAVVAFLHRGRHLVNLAGGHSSVTSTCFMPSTYW